MNIFNEILKLKAIVSNRQVTEYNPSIPGKRNVLYINYPTGDTYVWNENQYVIIQGEPGLDAYEVAVANGFEGIRSEWLASLEGNPSTWSEYQATQGVNLDANDLFNVGDVNIDTQKNINFINGSKIREATTDTGYGLVGLETVCALGYIHKWEAGKLFILNDDNTIREVRHQFDVPTFSEDVTKGYVIGSRVIIHNGNEYLCVDNTTEEAKWIEHTLYGENWTMVTAWSDGPVENGNMLKAIYNYAKTRTPYGDALSSTNRFKIIMGNGVYDTEDPFVVDAEFIDFVALNDKITSSWAWEVLANDVHIKGVDCGDTQRFFVNDNLPLLVIENCIGGDYSFGGGGTFSGTAKNCTAGDYSFGEVFNGNAIDCTAGNNGFGEVFSGIAENCIGGNYSFGYSQYLGTAKNCTAGDYSFGEIACEGNLTDCTAGNYSFAGCANGSGYFEATAIRCKAGNYSFASSDDYVCNCVGNLTDCIAGDRSFGSGPSGTFESTAIRCTGGDRSFGGGGGIFNGNAIDCIGSTDSFGGRAGSFLGIAIRCKGGGDSFGGGSGIFNGTVKYCIAEQGSFGFGPTGVFDVDGRAYHCSLISGTFPRPVDGGKIVDCINGDGSLAIITYSVSTLPTVNVVLGDKAYVTDADGDIYNDPVIGGGTRFVKVWYNGTTWVLG